VAAFSTLLLSIGLASGIIIRSGPQSFTWIYEHFLGLVTASIVYSTLQSLALYVWSFKGDKVLALGGNSESHIYNFRQYLIILCVCSHGILVLDRKGTKSYDWVVGPQVLL
jgi:hypothetical protein